ncbi:hypothetical protein VA7868_01131 [Vibrio aerogenes CECT 7868]|uniref:CUB domain-containing protein n=1 Tax=Vibrio aerogenes CECT 7868 TaxID=1216006 RepID=A0A1M5XFU3_9VIBR|nr:CUB domain-containing protein [Vibrio aerogenes]SHH98384.1 hypothetical protein VA7868_01131 [Vibrio aerogenes CECT 7868]
MNKYEIILRKLNPTIEEEVTIELNKTMLTVFAGICSYPIQVDQSYWITFSMSDFELHEQDCSEEYSVIRVNNAYSYELKGILNGDTIDTGVFKIQDEYLSFEFGYLDGKYICLYVDRLDIEFL